MDEVYQKHLGRLQQRQLLMKLDELRREAREKDQNSLTGGITAQASLQE